MGGFILDIKIWSLGFKSTPRQSAVKWHFCITPHVYSTSLQK